MQPDIEFFVDRCLGSVVVASALRLAGAKVHCLEPEFAADCEDEVWLNVVGGRGWVVLTKDDRLRTNLLEVSQIEANAIRVFTLPRGDWLASEMATIAVAALPTMLRIARHRPGPFVMRLSGQGGQPRELRRGR